MHRSAPPGQNRNKARWAALVLCACAPTPAFAVELQPTAWGSYLFFAIVAIVIIVLLLHEAIEEDVSPDDEERANDAFGMPRYVHARQDRSPGARRPRA